MISCSQRGRLWVAPLHRRLLGTCTEALSIHRDLRLRAAATLTDVEHPVKVQQNYGTYRSMMVHLKFNVHLTVHLGNYV